MNKWIAFFSLIRFKNLLMGVLIQILIKKFLIQISLQKSALDTNTFIVYLLALVLIVAAGYIINDIYDIETDKINKEEKRIVARLISIQSAYFAYFTLNFLGIICAIIAAYRVNHTYYALMFGYIAFSLWHYSKYNKKSFLIGNLQVAFLVALSIFNLGIFDIISMGSFAENGSEGVVYIIGIYAVFAFFMTLIREIIKDIEDIHGDQSIAANTLPIRLGTTTTKYIVMAIILVTMGGIGYFQYFQLITLRDTDSTFIYWGINKLAFIYTTVLQAMMLVLLFLLFRSDRQKDFHLASTVTKWIMLLGILSIPLFTYLHLH